MSSLSGTRSKGKQLLINIVAQLLAFAVNIGIGFFLTPYIIKTVGSTAYGFVGLANNFVSYVQILTTALNSMAGRFIAVSFYQDKEEDVKRYYTSVLFANLFISAALTIPCVFILVYLNKIVNVPMEILSDVRALWALIFATMMISIVGSIFNNAAYVKNRLELISLRTIESYIIKALILIGTFTILVPKVWYVGLASLICALYIICVNIYYTKKLMPMVKIRKKYFDFRKIRELISSGIWNSASQLGNVLSTGLDLLITNLLVGAGPMGIVSVSKTVPTYIQSLFVTVSSVFAPQLTISFAQGDKDGMKGQLAMAMKLMGLFASIPVAFVASYGEAFYSLWTPSQNANILMILTCAAVLEYPVSLLIYPVENIFSTMNKVKILSIITICSAACSCLTVLILLNFAGNELTKMLMVVGVSSFYNIFKNGVLIPRFCARILKISSKFFYAILGKSIISTVALLIVSLILRNILVADSWIKLILAGMIVALTGFIINFFFMLNNKDRKAFVDIIKSRIKR